MGLIHYDRVTKYFGERLLLNEITFAVERGERVALIGPNGSGKTTLARIGMGLEKVDSGSAYLARGVKAGYLTQDLKNLSLNDNALTLREHAVLEDKLRALEADMACTQGEEAALLMRDYERLTARFEAMDGYTLSARLKAAVMGLGLRQEVLLSPLSSLSSGERMRAALGRILLASPDLLVFDEPTNHLDIRATEWLEKYLLDFSGGVLVISHDRYFLDRVATRVIELNQASIIGHKGNYTSFLQQKEIRRAFVNSEKERLSREIIQQSDTARRLRANARIRQAQSREKAVERMRETRAELQAAQREGHLGAVSAVGLQLRADEHQSAIIARAENVGKRFGERVLFEHAAFLIRGGEHVAFIGSNGCGKTTLLRMMLGEDQDFTGRCEIGAWVKTALLDQNAVFEDESITMLAQAMRAPKLQSSVHPDDDARELLARLGFYGEECDKPISVLSGGERVRLKLALMLADEPQCIVLDEPTNHLDLPAREAVERAVMDFTGTVIAVSHDRYFLTHCVGRLIAFEDGGLKSYDGGWDDYVSSTRREETPAIHTGRHVVKRTEKTKKTPNAAERIESDIQEMEKKRADMEARMTPDADRSLYDEYNALLYQLDAMYTEWEIQISSKE